VPQAWLLTKTRDGRGNAMTYAYCFAEGDGYTAEYVETNGSYRFYGRDYPARLRRLGLTPLRFDPLRGVGAGFRRAHGLKADARVYLAFASPAAAAAFAKGARARISGSS